MGKSVSQSSTGWDGIPAYVVDGNRNGNCHNGSVSHTQSDSHAWWEVDLGMVYPLTSVHLWNRTDDCCATRLRDFHVLVSEVLFASQSLAATHGQVGVSDFHVPSPMGHETTIGLNRRGRYVRIRMSGVS